MVQRETGMQRMGVVSPAVGSARACAHRICAIRRGDAAAGCQSHPRPPCDCVTVWPECVWTAYRRRFVRPRQRQCESHHAIVRYIPVICVRWAFGKLGWRAGRLVRSSEERRTCGVDRRTGAGADWAQADVTKCRAAQCHSHRSKITELLATIEVRKAEPTSCLTLPRTRHEASNHMRRQPSHGNNNTKARPKPLERRNEVHHSPHLVNWVPTQSFLNPGRTNTSNTASPCSPTR
jgi:hypothetical protein